MEIIAFISFTIWYNSFPKEECGLHIFPGSNSYSFFFPHMFKF